MRKKVPPFFCLAFSFLMVNVSIAQNPGYSWIKTANGTGNETVTDVVAGNGAYLYTCGTFTSATVQLGGQTLTNSGMKDIFVAKYDTAGNLIWAKQIGGARQDEAVAIATDSLDNIYLTGNSGGAASFGTLNFTGTNFIAKINNVGDVLWVTEPTTNVTIKDIAADPNGNTVICGTFNGSCTIGGNAVMANESNDGFVARYNTSGNLSWFKQLYATKPSFNSQFSSVSEVCSAVAIAPNGTIGLCGETGGGEKLYIKNATITDTIFTTSVVWDAQQRYGPIGLAMQWDAAGNLLWIKDNLNDINSGRYWTMPQNAATNANADLYIAYETMGKASGAGNFIPRLAKYNHTGGLEWIKSITTYFSPVQVTPATNARVAFSGGKAYLSEKVTLFNSGAFPPQETRIHCINEYGTLQWSSVYSNNTSFINALAAKETAYAVGVINSGSFANLTPTYTDSADGFLAKLQNYTAPILPLAFSAPNPDKTICAGASIALASGITVTGGVQPYSYNWAPPFGLSNASVLNPTAMPASTTNYVLTVTDAVGSQLRDTILITVRAPLAKPTVQLIPGISPSVYDTLVCVSPEAGLSYDWRNSFGSLVGSAAKLLVFKAQAERYRVTITNGLNGCSASSDIFYYYFVKANAGNDTTICAGQPVTLGGNPAYFGMPGGTVSYHWLSVAGGLVTPTSPNPYITITPSVTADYILYIDDGGAIQEFMDTVRITVNPKPHLGPDTLIYHNCYLDTTNLLTLYNTSGLTATWNTATPSIAAPGNYQLIASTVAGCADTALVEIKLLVATWTGAISSDWHTAGNWNINQVPNALTHVIINSGTPNNCVIGSANAIAASVQLRNGAVLNTANGMTITIAGNCAVLPPN
jgi:Beta-propeller repeat